MQEWEGTIIAVDIGSGGWRLVDSKGESFELFGDIAPRYVGATVVVTGERTESFGFMMTGSDGIEVHSVRLKEG